MSETETVNRKVAKKPFASRANAKDRPRRSEECRGGNDRCWHRWRFIFGDRYGWCPDCGAEVLT